MLRNLFSEIVENVSLFLGGMLLGVALGIIATLIGVTAYMNKDKN
jgi:hypothetical protein